MMRALGTGLVALTVLLGAGETSASDPLQAPSAVPRPGAASSLDRSQLAAEDRAADAAIPARIVATLRKLKPEQPALAASIGGSHSASLYRALSPLVVLVVTDDGLGSGSIVSADSYVLTNNHVILGFKEVAVILKPVVEGDTPSDADAFTADVVKVDEVADLALLKIRDWSPWEFVPLGDAAAVSVGDDVHAIGHPHGETWTYTKGVISAMRRGYSWSYENEFRHQADVIQTQTPINPGNSGGPLFDDEGRLIGVNSFGDDSAQGLNFAVSVTEVRRFLDAPEGRYAAAAAAAETQECAPAILFEGRNADDNAEIRMTDQDCDDQAEVIEVWYDDESLGYAVEFDEDGNGRWETAVIDSDRDGKWDFSLYDTDNDGIVDLRGLHPDGAWDPSEYEKV